MSETRKLVGILVAIEFRSLVDTARCTLEVQTGLIERLTAGAPPPRPFFLSCEKAERMRFEPRRSSG
jgi:hypothetical protein